MGGGGVNDSIISSRSTNHVVLVFFKLLFKLLDLFLEVLEFLGELLTYTITLCTLLGAEGGPARPRKEWRKRHISHIATTLNLCLVSK